MASERGVESECLKPPTSASEPVVDLENNNSEACRSPAVASFTANQFQAMASFTANQIQAMASFVAD